MINFIVVYLIGVIINICLMIYHSIFYNEELKEIEKFIKDTAEVNYIIGHIMVKIIVILFLLGSWVTLFRFVYNCFEKEEDETDKRN